MIVTGGKSARQVTVVGIIGHHSDNTNLTYESRTVRPRSTHMYPRDVARERRVHGNVDRDRGPSTRSAGCQFRTRTSAECRKASGTARPWNNLRTDGDCCAVGKQRNLKLDHRVISAARVATPRHVRGPFSHAHLQNQAFQHVVRHPGNTIDKPVAPQTKLIKRTQWYRRTQRHRQRRRDAGAIPHSSGNKIHPVAIPKRGALPS